MISVQFLDSCLEEIILSIINLRFSARLVLFYKFILCVYDYEPSIFCLMGVEIP